VRWRYSFDERALVAANSQSLAMNLNNAMKPKNFILIALIVAIMCVVIWRFMRPTVATPEKMTVVPIPAKADAPKQVSSQTIAPPVAPPAPKSGAAPVATTQSIVTPPPDPNVDPQADLKTAVLDIARLLRDGGDTGAFLETYTPPDELTPQRIQEIQMGMQRRADMAAQDPFFKQVSQDMVEMYAKAYESLENQTPTYNDAGDEATYMLIFVYRDGSSDQSSKTFVKINGKWYLKPTDGN
jgi:hypothetical protein